MSRMRRLARLEARGKISTSSYVQRKEDSQGVALLSFLKAIFMEPHFRSYKEGVGHSESWGRTLPWGDPCPGRGSRDPDNVSKLGRALNCGKGLPFVSEFCFKMETIQARTRGLF